MMQQLFLGYGFVESTGGTVTGSWSGSDGYSGGSQGATQTCRGVAHNYFDARPPSQSQVNQILSSWMNCKSYVGDGVTVAYNAGVTGYFWGRSGNSLTLTFSGFSASKEMAMYLYTTGSRPINFSGLYSGTVNNIANDYLYFSLNSSGGGTITASFAATGDPPYLYWTGPRYAPGYY
tara:strand:- start:2272 stop:2802 length:531 start_codon:yes stop_codon:yes gene_type:complete